MASLRSSRGLQGGAQPLAARVAGQGTLLMCGYALAQGLSFARNALIGHWLSPADFGVAATLTLMLQLLESLSDLGADRLIVQAPDGNRARLMANAHLLLICRGALTALALYLAAAPLARFFGVEAARGAFEALALAPLIRGFLHLDFRRDQRRLDNRAAMIVEVVPQAIALAVALPILSAASDYWAVVWISAIQAAAVVMTSLSVARRRYLIGTDGALMRRLLLFGWPIMLSALPLLAVNSGDRIVIGRLLGMEALAAYSVAFMMTMVPGLLAAKVGHALMLPLLSAAQTDDEAFRRRFAALVDAATLVAALYLTMFVIAGGAILPVAFGPSYAGLDDLVAMLAVMWTIRMVQAVPGMALIARGETRPLLVAGIIRAGALAVVIAAAMGGYGIVAIAAAGAAGEAASLLYVAWRAGQELSGLGRAFLTRTALLVPAAVIAETASRLLPAEAGVMASISVASLVAAAVALSSVAALARLRKLLSSLLPTLQRRSERPSEI